MPHNGQNFQRVVPLRSVHNFRDYGGYGVRGGGRLKSGMLYRSGELSRATAEDQALIAKLDLAAVIDLRSGKERELAPTRLGPEFGGQIFFAESYAEARAPHVRAAQAVRETPDVAMIRARLRKAFEKIPFQSVMISVFRMYFDTLSNISGASLVHCAAGKDRTGIAAALLQAAMGVHIDDIRADFLLTNTAGDVAARIAALAPAVRSSLGPDATEAAVLTTLSVEAEYLDAMFAMIEAEGGLDAYLKDRLGLPAAQLETLQRRLVV